MKDSYSSQDLNDRLFKYKDNKHLKGLFNENIS